MENESCALYKGKMWSILNQDGGPGTHFITAPNSICVDCYKKLTYCFNEQNHFNFMSSCISIHVKNWLNEAIRIWNTSNDPEL